MNKVYNAINFADVILLKTFTIVMPLICALTEANLQYEQMSIALLGKWFMFWVGLRLLMRPIKTILSRRPITKFDVTEILLALISIISLCISQIRVVTGIILLLFFCFLVVRRSMKGVGSINGWLALATDVLTFILLLIYVIVVLEK